MPSEKFTAPTLPEAIEMIRRRWGAEAVILHVQRRVEPKRFFAPARQWVEVTAMPPPATGRSERSVEVAPPLPIMEQLDGLRGEIRQYQTTVRQLERIQWARTQCDAKVLKHPLLEFLLERGLSVDCAVELLAEWISAQESLDLARCMAEMDKRLPRLSVEDLFPPQAGKCTLFLGLPGCGKTLLMTKVAARLCLARRGEVVFVSADLSRMGASQDLILYSEIFQIPVITLFDLAGLKEVIEKVSPTTQILVDWKGVSPLDSKSWELLQSLPHEALKLQLILTTSMVSDLAILKPMRERLAGLPVMGLALTQGDLEPRVGKVWEAHRTTGLPLAFFSAGQNIPGDFYDGKGFPFARCLFAGYQPAV